MTRTISHLFAELPCDKILIFSSLYNIVFYNNNNNNNDDNSVDDKNDRNYSHHYFSSGGSRGDLVDKRS